MIQKASRWARFRIYLATLILPVGVFTKGCRVRIDDFTLD